MTSYTSTLIQKHATSGVLIDTNILLLFLIGSYDKNLIERFKRTQIFAPEDYDTLVKFIGSFNTIVTTPNIITEVSNLLGQLPENIKATVFRKFIHLISVLSEQYISSRDVSALPEFIRFGVTDMSITTLSQVPHLVLTDDFRLSQYLQSKGADVINFNHIRTTYWS